MRRLPSVATSLPSSEWLARSTVVVAGSDSTADEWWAKLHYSTVLNTRGSLAPSSRSALLQRVNRGLPLDRRLRFDQVELTRELENPFHEIDAFLSGAFRTHEMAFLSGLSKNVIGAISRKHTELQPRQFSGLNYWTFPTLVGIRTWNYLRKTTRRRLDPALAAQFVKMSGTEHAVPMAVTASGEILMEVGDGSFSNEEGQLTSEVFFVAGEIRQRFSLGGQRIAPDLLAPSAMTSVNPVVYGGSPTVKGSRITVDAIDRLARLALSDGMTGSEVLRYVQQRFPEIGAQELDEARQVARELLAVS